METFDELHKRDRANENQLDARIASFEPAFRMQQEASEAFDLSKESEKVQQLYGIGLPEGTNGREYFRGLRHAG